MDDGVGLKAAGQKKPDCVRCALYRVSLSDSEASHLIMMVNNIYQPFKMGGFLLTEGIKKCVENKIQLEIALVAFPVILM